MSALRFTRVLCAVTALGLPFALVASSASGFVEPLSRAAVDALLVATGSLQPASAAAVVEAPAVDEPLPLPTDDVLASTTTKKAALRKNVAPKPQAPAALFVSAETVLRLSQSAARPQGAFVAATATHPAGLRLSSVAALGIGVQDGDILIDALGVAPRSPGQIIGAIIEARAKQVRYLSGSIWRRGHTFRITVEQPYLAPATADSASP